MKNPLFYLLVFLVFLLPNNHRASAGITDGYDDPDSVSMMNSHCAPETTDNNWYSSGTKAPMFEGLDGIDLRITTKNREAQEYFNQGMMLSYGFNHAEAARSFYESIRLDSSCAMCYWGYAYVLGPNYNGGMEPDNFDRAYEAAQKSMLLAENTTPVEKALIHALNSRYAEDPPEDRSSLDINYSRAMKGVYEQFPAVPDVGALYAESLMDLHPWDLYEKKSKEPKEWTQEIIDVLEHLIKINPRHPGAHHFYIHAVEASSNPDRGLPSAKLLETLVPGAGHLVHMPAHIYINTGDYHLGTIANLNAVKVDGDYVTACHAQGTYPLALFPHNYHFLAATATLEGNSTHAWTAAKKIHQKTSNDIMKQPGWGTLQHYHTIPYYVAVKFALWDTILSFPTPTEDLVYPRSVLHYARGMAWLAKMNISQAENELTKLKKLSGDSSLQSLTIWGINSTHDLMQIAVNVLAGEIASQKNLYEEAVILLSRAIAIEDMLNYNEPPDWFFSVRHHLGMVMLKAGKYADAETIFNEDLLTYRENGWALYGLYIALQKQGKADEAQSVKLRYEKAWKHADFKIPLVAGL